MDISVAAVNSPSERLFPSSSSSGDENERIMMAKSGLSHFEWNQASEEVRLFFLLICSFEKIEYSLKEDRLKNINFR